MLDYGSVLFSWMFLSQFKHGVPSKRLLSWCDCRWKLQFEYKADRVILAILAAIWSARLSHRHWAVNYRLVKVPHSCPKAFGSECSGAGLRHPQLFLLPTHLGREFSTGSPYLSMTLTHSYSRIIGLADPPWFLLVSYTCVCQRLVFFQQFQSDQPCMIHQVVR